jgi:D-lactate dehydrogenase
MNIPVFSAQPYDRHFLTEAAGGTELAWEFLEATLDRSTARLASGCETLCAFVNDRLEAEVLQELHSQGLRGIALRCAGFNNVDLEACRELGIRVARVPAYSPHAVAEHTVALLLTLNRKLHKAYNRVREGNFSLSGLMGFDLHGKTVGVVGTGKIGRLVIDIFRGFGCRILAHDPYPAQADIEYTDLPTLLRESKVVTLHLPLTPDSYHIIGREALQTMPPGAILVNTSRGALVDSKAVIDALKSGHLGGLAIDVYEEEGDLFFRDLSHTVIQDDVFARLASFSNVLISGHQAFFTEEALRAIAETTVRNLEDLRHGRPLEDREVPLSAAPNR